MIGTAACVETHGAELVAPRQGGCLILERAHRLPALKARIADRDLLVARDAAFQEPWDRHRSSVCEKRQPLRGAADRSAGRTGALRRRRIETALTKPDPPGRLEALNSKVRLISHRAYGFHSAEALIAMIYLCCARITIALPHR